MVGWDGWSKTWTFFNGNWQAGNIPIMGPRTHAAWAASTVFDGARAFEGVTPDLVSHCARINQSATNMHLKPIVSASAWVELVLDGLKRFSEQSAIYIRPMYWAERNGPSAIAHDPESTEWCLTLYEAPMPAPGEMSITYSPFHRPTIETMPLDAKAGCLYPNNARALFEARSRGFDNCLLCDALGNVAELTNANIFLAKGNVVFTPVPNGTFLDGITRRRVIELLTNAGLDVVERSLRYQDFQAADEIFSTGNYAKVMPVTRIDERRLQPGPVFRKARALYWDFAHSESSREPVSAYEARAL